MGEFGSGSLGIEQQGSSNKVPEEGTFFSDCAETGRYKLIEIVGKGSYGVVCSAVDTQTGERVAIKKIPNIFETVTDAMRVLREIKLLRLLRHPDVVDIKCILLPWSRRSFKGIYVVFELMDSDLHQVLSVNDHLKNEHHCFFLYQMLRALKYMHTANVYHRDLKPKNILVNANCNLKICDFGLARVALDDSPSTACWTDYVATRWYRAPELCGSFSCRYTPAIDLWSVGCIFAEILTGTPLFPGKNMLNQLDLINDVLGTPSADTISQVENERARNYLMALRKKQPVPLTEKFPDADPLAVRLLERMLAFNPNDRPSAEEALADPYFKGLSRPENEPSCQAFSSSEFEFEMQVLTKDRIRELIFREILEYHPWLLKDYTQRKSIRCFRFSRSESLMIRLSDSLMIFSDHARMRSLSCGCIGGHRRRQSEANAMKECRSNDPLQQEEDPLHQHTPCSIRINSKTTLSGNGAVSIPVP